MKKNILGIKIDDVTMDEALETVGNWLKGSGKHYIVTPNPEIIMAAQKDNRYKSILNDADLSIPDGIGLKLSGKVKNTIAGVDFMERLVDQSRVWASTVGLLGGKDRVADKAVDCLRKKYPGVKIVYAESGGEVDEEGKSLKSLKLLKCDLLFVGFGPPKQEKWIAKNLGSLNIKVVMAVGGSLDYISGEVPRAPKLVRNFGLEWLFRLAVQPWRIKRQFALIEYLFLLSRH